MRIPANASLSGPSRSPRRNAACGARRGPALEVCARSTHAFGRLWATVAPSVSSGLRRLSRLSAAVRARLKAATRRRGPVADPHASGTLLDAESHYLALFEQAEIGIYQISPDGGTWQVNRALARINGFDSVGEMRDRVTNLADGWYVDPARRTEFQRLLHEDGHVRDFVSEIHRHATRGRTWVTETAWVVRDAAGMPIRYEGTVLDATDRVLAREGMAKSEALYRLLAENATDMIGRTSLGGIRQFVSPASFELLGRRPEDLVGTHLLDVIQPADRPDVAAALERLARGDADRATSVARMIHRAGRDVWCEIRFRLVRDDAGRPCEFVSVTRDVGERIRAERALRASETRLRVALDAGGTYAWERDAATAELLQIGDDAGLLGLPPADAASRGRDAFMAHIHPDDRIRLLEAARAASGPGARFAVEYRFRRPADGREMWLSDTGRAVSDEGGVPRLLGIGTDVTARKRGELALASAKAEAEQARSEAEAANEAKTDFLASMSHEIRTPLNGVLGYAELLLDDTGLHPGHRRMVEHILDGGRALLTVVDDILNLSKIEAGEVVFEARPFAPGALIESTVAIIRTLAEKKGLSLEVRVDAALPGRVVGDENRLRQILLNLVNNAIKFTPAGRVTVRAIAHESGSTDRLRFIVDDTGIGIPADRWHRLFQRFSQADGSIQREFGGTGLGLAICKRLVDLMQGEIGFESEVGRGSTFWFEVPLPAIPATKADDAGDRAPTAPAWTASRGRILLVDDIAANREFARAVLQKAGYAVVVASDGAEAARSVATSRFDLVLMDLQMPGTDGFAATGRIRALDGPAGRVPIVAMTANVLPRQIARAMEAGIDDHVGKPFRREVLLATVARWIAADAGAEGSSAPADGVVLDRDVLDGVVSLLGAEASDRLLRELASEIRARFGGRLDDRDRALLARDAHDLLSAAGTFGFARLAAACRALEEASRSDVPLRRRLSRLADARDATLARIEALLAR